MSLKDLTSAKHTEAESTPFMKAVFAKTLPFDLWVYWTYQKCLFYGAIEGAAGANRLLGVVPDLRRAFYLAMAVAGAVVSHQAPAALVALALLLAVKLVRLKPH